MDALVKAGCGFNSKELSKVSKLDLFNDGYTGKSESAEKRTMLLKELKLPTNLSVNGLLDALNTFVGYEEYKRIKKESLRIADSVSFCKITF